jgi:hypothetical protein
VAGAVRTIVLSAAMASSAGAACQPLGSPQRDVTTRTAPTTLAFAADALPHVEPVQPAHRGEAMAERNRQCEGCHADVAADWRASLHRASWTEPAFQRAYDREPLAFCRGCHAPEAPLASSGALEGTPSPPASPSVEVGQLGVGCVTCHLDGASILGASEPPAGPEAHRGAAPHAVVRDGRLDAAVACAGCHEFGFPKGGAPFGPTEPMQMTVDEHRVSPAAGRSCASCHMPIARGRRSHRFAASRDEAMLRSAVRVDARRDGTRVEVRLASLVEGHAFPTGDLFRRVEILAEAVAPREVLAASATRYLARHFPFAPVAPGGPRARSFGPDDRLRQEPVAVVLDLGEPARDLPVRYRVAYQRVAHPRSADEQASEIDGEVVLSQGELPAVDPSHRPAQLRASAP